MILSGDMLEAEGERNHAIAVMWSFQEFLKERNLGLEVNIRGENFCIGELIDFIENSEIK